MAAITVSRQLGSLGCDVARAAAELLEYRVLWRDLINQAAQRAGAPEMALVAIDELGMLGLTLSAKAGRAYRHAVAQVMKEAAQTGSVVIVGRAGQAILQDQPQVLHVRVVAPGEVRVERLARRHAISPECAMAQIEASDRHRRNYLRRYYHVRWDEAALYDLTINTAHISPRTAAGLIVKALICKAALNAEAIQDT